MTTGIFLIVGCSSGDEDAPTPTFAEQSESFEDVDPAAFERGGTTLFDYRTGDEGTGICIIDTEAAVTCTGRVPDDAPDIECLRSSGNVPALRGSPPTGSPTRWSKGFRLPLPLWTPASGSPWETPPAG